MNGSCLVAGASVTGPLVKFLIGLLITSLHAFPSGASSCAASLFSSSLLLVDDIFSSQSGGAGDTVDEFCCFAVQSDWSHSIIFFMMCMLTYLTSTDHILRRPMTLSTPDTLFESSDLALHNGINISEPSKLRFLIVFCIVLPSSTIFSKNFGGKIVTFLMAQSYLYVVKISWQW